MIEPKYAAAAALILQPARWGRSSTYKGSVLMSWHATCTVYIDREPVTFHFYQSNGENDSSILWVFEGKAGAVLPATRVHRDITFNDAELIILEHLGKALAEGRDVQ